MISQLELRNFKRHTAANFTFGEGLTSIAGPNAQGKTTLLKGILFALLGASAAGSKEHLTTRGSAGDTGVSLRLKVPVHGEVRIERTLKGAKIFSADGTLIANGTTPTIKLIEEAYGMSSADLQLLMYSRQGESQALLAMGAAALQRTVERLAKTGLVDKVLDLISRDLSRLEGELAGMGSLPDLARLRKEREHSLSVVAAQQQVLATVNARLAVSVASEQSLQQRYNTARDHEVLAAGWQSKLDASGPRLAALQQSVEDYRTTLENLPDYPQTEFDTRYAEIERLNRRQQDLDGRGRAVRNAELEIIKLKAEAARLETRIDQSQRVAGDIEQAEETLRRLTEQRATLRQALATAVTAVKQAEIALSAAVCGECHRPYSAEELKLANARFEATCQLRDAAATELDANAGPLKQATDHLAQLRKDFHPG
ncbi:MAG: AAA family ATPase, partial [Methylococcaceae bacterium]